jgi:hypothetical protein
MKFEGVSEIIALSEESLLETLGCSLSVRSLERSLEMHPDGLVQWSDLLDLYSDIKSFTTNLRTQSFRFFDCG